jgi:hypothetical protein
MTCFEDPELNDAEIARRRDDVIRRMANTPPKPHSEMKVGKRKAKASAKANSSKKRRRPAWPARPQPPDSKSGDLSS